MNGLDHLIERINHSPVFLMEREKEPTIYEREKNRLIENIYLYKLQENPENEEYGLEIIETIKDCLQYFEAEKGLFMNYFNRAFAQRKTKVKAQNRLQEKSAGMHFTRKEIDAARALHAYLQKHEELSPADLLSVLKDNTSELEMSAEELLEAINTYTASFVQSGDLELSDEEGFTLFDILAAKSDITEDYAGAEMISNLIDLCEEEFLKARDGTKDVLSVKLTSLFADWDHEGAYTKLIQGKAFYSPEIFEAVYYADRKIKNKEISSMLGKSEANLTQIWKRFQKKLQERLREIT